jgi:hypothetical protein
MSSQSLAFIFMVMGLVLIIVIGARAVRGERAAFYRISAVCLAMGLSFNTTEAVTGDAMSEFGAFCFFVGVFVGGILVFVDTFSDLQRWFATKKVATHSSNESLTLPPADDSVPNGM